MRRLLTAGMLALAAAAWQAPEAVAQYADEQALEQAIREARAMGLSGPQIEQLEEMLAAFRARGSTAPAGPTMLPSHFETMNARDYADCEQYLDDQAYTFCGAATVGYLQYTQIFVQQGDSDAARQTYDAHAATVENLVNYVDNFMTAPRRY